MDTGYAHSRTLKSTDTNLIDLTVDELVDAEASCRLLKRIERDFPERRNSLRFSCILQRFIETWPAKTSRAPLHLRKPTPMDRAHTPRCSGGRLRRVRRLVSMLHAMRKACTSLIQTLPRNVVAYKYLVVAFVPLHEISGASDTLLATASTDGCNATRTLLRALEKRIANTTG